MPMAQFDFLKIEGTGNDFIFIDLITDENALSRAQEFWSTQDNSTLAKKVCDRKFGPGADGLVIIHPHPGNLNFKWEFYNSDGSSAEMCGNAARCATLFAFTYHFSNHASVCFETIAGTIEGQISENGLPIVSMTAVKDWKESIELELTDQNVSVSYLDSGVPHAVWQLPHFSNYTENRSACSEIRNHDSFAPKGSNATIYSVLEPGHILSASFERGVEDFTLACGTGAVAAAVTYNNKNGNSLSKVQVDVPGGELFIHVGGPFPRLEGPAQIVYRGLWGN